MRTALAVTLALLTLGATPRPQPAEVHLTFSGVLVHVLDASRPARVVALNGEGHMAHTATLVVQRAQVAETDLALQCDAEGVCAIPLDGKRIRFAGAKGRPTYDAGGSFDLYVPHLRGITGGAFASITEDVWADAPRGVIGAMVDLPPGRLSATPHDARGLLVPDLEHRGPRHFGREVYLVSRIAAPELELFDGKAWTSIRFRGELVELRVTNEPLHPIDHSEIPRHFDLSFGLSASPIPIRPRIVPGGGVAAEDRGASGTVAGCSNNQWP